MCTTFGSACTLQYTYSGIYTFNVASIFVQEYMPIMSNVCIPVFLITMLMVLGSFEVNILP